MMTTSAHFSERQSQRGLRHDVLNFILEFGEMRFARKTAWLVIEKKKLPGEVRNTSLAERAARWVIMLKDDVLVTCYRNDNPFRSLRCSN